MKPSSPPIPDITDLDISDADFDKLDFERRQWQCCIKDCNRFTRVKDIGKSPFFWWRKRLIDISKSDFYCGKHWKLFKQGTLEYKEGRGLDHLSR